MGSEQTNFDDDLRAALKRTLPAEGTPSALRAKVATMLAAGAPVAPPAPTSPSTPMKIGRVLGMPRPLGIAAGIAFFLVAAGLLGYQLREFLPGEKIAPIDPVQSMLGGLVQVHQQMCQSTEKTADLADFQRKLPSEMPLATLHDPGAKFVGGSLVPLVGQTCYALQYKLDEKLITLVTANARVYYDIPRYNQVESGLRLVGGEKNGYLVCVIGDQTLPQDKMKGLLDGAAMLSSPSTQPVSALSVHCPSH